MSININIRLRPIRFGFLVKPSDSKNLLKIFQVNTCLWGGRYNPIIPIFKSVPTWWDRKDYGFENSRQIINGYLDFFEPDFLVETEKGLSDGLGYNSERVINIDQILMAEGEDEYSKYGQSVNDLYKYLFEKKYQFQLRDKPSFLLAQSKNIVDSTFLGCVFGAFPSNEDLKYFEENYKYVFEPSVIEFSDSTIKTMYEEKHICPLRVGCAELDPPRFSNREDPVLFIMDSTKSRDLIDYWNLRAVQTNVVPIPIQHIEILSRFCKNFISENYRPLPGNKNGVMIQPKSMFSRSIPEAEIENLHTDYLHINTKGANCIQTWYPPIWRESPNFAFRETRPLVTAKEESHYLDINEESSGISFDSLSPDFTNDRISEHKWANVVSLNNWSAREHVATVFPSEYKNPKSPLLSTLHDYIIPTTEGLVLFPKYKGSSETWKLKDGVLTIESWLKGQEISTTLSPSGSATQQIIKTLEGFYGVRALAHKGIVKLLHSMANRPVTHSAIFKTFQDTINKSLKNIFHAKYTFNTLVEKHAVQLGIEVRCKKCKTWCWYSLSAIDYVLSCTLCLNQFDFPISTPSGSDISRWAYRVIGPFALPDFASGGYAASLSIRFFGDVIGFADQKQLTWAPGQELSFPTGEKVEADYILWYQRQVMMGLNYPTELVFGEAKSFGKDSFTKLDVDRMMLLAKKFPGSILVFSTLKAADELSSKEIKRIRKLALWGRKYDKERRRSRAPVILLTGTELFVRHDLSETWRTKSDLHTKFIETAYIKTQLCNLRVLADLTQQLYLGLDSYSNWSMKRLTKRSQN